MDNPWGIQPPSLPGEAQDHGWGQPQSLPGEAQDHGWGPQEVTNSENEHTPRNVDVVDLSEDDGEQDPPPPKKPKVVHESSDDRNLGT